MENIIEFKNIVKTYDMGGAEQVMALRGVTVNSLAPRFIGEFQKGIDYVGDLKEFEEQFLPEFWKHPPEAALKAGHGGGDYFEVADFVDAILADRQPPVGVHEAMDMTVPGLVSQESIRREGEWVEVPDSRKWGEGITG